MPTLKSPLDSPPPDTYAFLFQVGFFRVVDIPFILGALTSPLWVYAIRQNVWFNSILLLVVFAYQLWVAVLVFRGIRFVIESIRATYSVTQDAARSAVRFMSGGKA